jgi:O-antigen/teichoic acid export membrane protein
VFVADAARAARDEPDALVRLFRRTTRSLALMAIGPAIVIAVTAPFLTSLVFGAEWGDAGIYVAVLVPMFFVTFVSTATGNILYIVERQGLHLVREIVRLGLLAGSILVAARFGLPPIGTLIVLSVAGCVTYVLYWLLSWRAVLAFARSRDLSPPADGVVGVNPGSRDG